MANARLAPYAVLQTVGRPTYSGRLQQPRTFACREGGDITKRLEIIHLRLAGNTSASLINDIRRSVFAGAEKAAVRFYFHETISTDLSVHIHTETKTRNVQTSRLGLRLTAELREYGMVQHTVWIEEQSEPK